MTDFQKELLEVLNQPKTLATGITSWEILTKAAEAREIMGEDWEVVTQPTGKKFSIIAIRKGA